MEAQGRTYIIRKIDTTSGFSIPTGIIANAIDSPKYGGHYQIVGGVWDGWTTNKNLWEPYTLLPPELFEL